MKCWATVIRALFFRLIDCISPPLPVFAAFLLSLQQSSLTLVLSAW